MKIIAAIWKLPVIEKIGSQWGCARRRRPHPASNCRPSGSAHYREEGVGPPTKI